MNDIGNDIVSDMGPIMFLILKLLIKIQNKPTLLKTFKQNVI